MYPSPYGSGVQRSEAGFWAALAELCPFLEPLGRSRFPMGSTSSPAQSCSGPMLSRLPCFLTTLSVCSRQNPTPDTTLSSNMRGAASDAQLGRHSNESVEELKDIYTKTKQKNTVSLFQENVGTALCLLDGRFMFMEVSRTHLLFQGCEVFSTSTPFRCWLVFHH